MTNVQAVEKVYEPKDPAGLSRLLIVLLWIDLVAGLFNGVSTLAELQILNALPGDTPVTDGPPLPQAVLILRALISVVTLVSAMVTGFFCLKWIYRVSLNAHSLVKGLTITPGWAVGWYFVPIALLFKPFQALKEAWQASANPLAWRSVDTPGVLRWWWGLWLSSSVLSNISLRLGLEAKSVGMLVVTDGIDVVAALVGIPLNLVFMEIVRRLSANQVGALSQRVFA